MPYKTFTAGEIFTAANLMTYLMDQANITVPSGSRPSSPSQGMEIFETDTGRKLFHDGTQWREWAQRIVCTSSTRPSSPVAGMTVYETDTGAELVWNGSAWVARSQLPGIGQVQFVRKTSNTSRSNTNTLAADPHLSVPLEANATYVFEAYLSHDAPSTANIQYAFDVPASSVLNWTPDGFVQTPSSAASAAATADIIRRMNTTADTPLTPRGISDAGSTEDTVSLPKGSVRTSGTAGNLTLFWAQNTLNASNTVLRVDSWLRVMRVE